MPSKNTVRLCLFIFTILLQVPGRSRLVAHAGDYDYMLNFELDSRTGSYRPAYTYKSSRGNSTIWLDRSSKKTRPERAVREDGEKHFISCTWPAGWKVTKDAERAAATHPDGSVFTIFPSRPLAGSGSRDDMVQEWSARAQPKYGALSPQGIVSGQFKNGGLFLVAAKTEGKAVALAVLYSGQRALPVMVEFPDRAAYDRRRSEFKSFLSSIEIKKGKIDRSR